MSDPIERLFELIDFEAFFQSYKWRDANGNVLFEGFYDLGANFFDGASRVCLVDDLAKTARIPLSALGPDERERTKRFRDLLPLATRKPTLSLSLDEHIDLFLDALPTSIERDALRPLWKIFGVAPFDPFTYNNRLCQFIEKSFGKPCDKLNVEEFLSDRASEAPFARFLLVRYWEALKNDLRSSQMDKERAAREAELSKKIDSMLLSAADQDLPPALYELAERFYWGCGERRDLARAVKLYQKAAELGCAFAQFRLSVFYKEGCGVKKQKDSAVYWAERAFHQGVRAAKEVLEELGSPCGEVPGSADQGLPSAEDVQARAERAACSSILSHLFLAESGLAAAELELYLRSETSDPAAACYCALFYLRPNRPDRDENKGVEFLKTAAKNGLGSAFFILGVLTELGGASVPKNPVRAMSLYKRALDKGVELARKSLEALESEFVIFELDEPAKDESAFYFVKDLDVAYSDGNVFFKWTAPPSGIVLIYATTKRVLCEKKAGATRLEKLPQLLGPPLELTKTKDYYYCSSERFRGSKTWYFLPIVLDGDKIAIGSASGLGRVDPIEGLALTFCDEGSYATWDWASDCDYVFVVANASRPPSGLKDAASRRWKLTRADYDRDGGLPLAENNMRRAFYQIFQSKTIGEKRFFSDPATFCSRPSFISYWREERNGYASDSALGNMASRLGLGALRRTSYEGTYLTFESDDGQPIPELIVVKQWGRPPLNRNDGDVVATIPASDEDWGEFRLDELFSQDGGVNEFFRCYLADRSDCLRCALLDPPDSELRLKR